MLVIVKRLEELQKLYRKITEERNISPNTEPSDVFGVAFLADLQKRIRSIEYIASKNPGAPEIRGILDTLGPSEPLTDTGKLQQVQDILDSLHSQDRLSHLSAIQQIREVMDK